MILYSIWILVVSLAFYVVKVDNLSYLFASIYDVGRWPSTIFRGVLAFVFTFVIPIAVMTTFPSRSQPGGPEKIESERPRVPWLSMHSTSSAGASELRNCPAWLLVGDGIGGGPAEHAVTAQPRSMTAAAQMSGCLFCRTYGSLECDRLYHGDGQRRDPVRGERRGKSSHRRRSRKIPALGIRHLGVVFPENVVAIS